MWSLQDLFFFLHSSHRSKHTQAPLTHSPVSTPPPFPYITSEPTARSQFFSPQSCGLEKKAFPDCSAAHAMTWLSFSLIPFRFPLAWFYSYIKATVREKKGEAAVQTCFLERYLRFYCQDERHSKRKNQSSAPAEGFYALKKSRFKSKYFFKKHLQS